MADPFVFFQKRQEAHCRRRARSFNLPVFRAHFYKRKSEGPCCKMAILATAHKLIRVMFAMLVHQTCFEQGGR